MISCFGLFIAGLLSCAVGGFLALFLSLFAPKADVKTETIALVAFRDGANIHGSFFLGCGSIDNEDVYLCYTQRVDGAIQKLRVEERGRNSVLIYEENRTDGVLEAHERQVDPKSNWRFWAFSDARPTHVFRVPKGTVIRQFRADLGN